MTFCIILQSHQMNLPYNIITYVSISIFFLNSFLLFLFFLFFVFCYRFQSTDIFYFNPDISIRV